MALSDSMFLFEVLVEEFKSFMHCKEFSIKCQFADVFSLHLREPNNITAYCQGKKIKSKQKVKVRSKISLTKIPSKTKLQTGQSILLANNIDWLLSKMKSNPLELSLWSRKSPEKRIGVTRVPWCCLFVEYLVKMETGNKILPPALAKCKCNILSDFSSKCVATITISVKLSHLKEMTSTNPNFQLESQRLDNVTHKFDIIETSHEQINSQEFQDPRNINLDSDLNNEQDAIFNCGRNKETTSFIRISKSDHRIDGYQSMNLNQSKSLSSINCYDKLNPLSYIFGSPNGSFGNRVYCVSYFTIENEVSGKNDSPKGSTKEQNLEMGNPPKKMNEKRYHLKLCDDECPRTKGDNASCSQSICSIDLPDEAGHLIHIKKCKQIDCDNKTHRVTTSATDDRILLDLTSLKRECCDYTEKIEEVVGGLEGQMKISNVNDPCFCTCECRFGFTKRTTYCKICGGYEVVGEEIIPSSDNKMPFPCPIFHKLIDKNKLKNWSTSGSESKKRGGDDQSLKNMKIGSGQKATASDKRQPISDKKSFESEKDSKKGKKKKKDDRFKFNYGYKGIPPQIGHSECAMPCTGTLGAVPKNMGWLWTAEDTPGMKFRPMWKPGAVNKHVVRLLRIAKNPGEVIAKKRRKDAGKKKRPLKRPLLIVSKKEGEYTVTMETMKTYSRPRALNQHPYEDKPVLTYTIGRTDEENRDRRKKKEREQRRLERAQRQFIQSAFRDMCHEICLKTYEQALGILPGAEEPDCNCFTAQSDKVNMDVSCSCSEDKSSIGSDTDSDEWMVEFTPPNAFFDPTYKGKKVLKADSESQYTYLDYRVKLVDRFGNPVPRFFKGPDGKQQCSDLGGFWSPDRKWLEINIDGYVAPDGRWAPNNFVGPSGEQVDAEAGKFQATNGKWLVVGVDGYVDCLNKWRFYSKPRGTTQRKRHPVTGGKKGGAGDRKDDKRALRSEASWSCFGDVSPKHLSRMGIVGHGQDRKLLLATLRNMLAHGEDVKIPQPSTVYRLPSPKKGKKARVPTHRTKSYLEDRFKCHHPLPSDKGVVATDDQGNKTYFRLKEHKNRRPRERLAHLVDQGISVSSFHVPCFHSFINAEIMRRQQRERLLALAGRSVATQVA